MRGFACVDALDPRVRIHRAQERDVKRVRQPDIVNVVAESLDQSRVLGSLHSLSDVLSHKASELRIANCESQIAPPDLDSQFEIRNSQFP
jgi:hypothetical protein